MKHTYTVILAILLVIALAIPAFASDWDQVEASIIESVANYDAVPSDCAFVTILYTNGYCTIYFSDKPIVATYAKPDYATRYDYYLMFASDSVIYSATASTGRVEYLTVNRVYNWNTSKAYTTGNVESIISNYDIFYDNGEIYNYGLSDECSGSACPATDNDHDNICDDCGNVLAFSLRSSLLDYAYTHKDNGMAAFPDTDYWLITDNTEGGYTIHIATEPFKYGMSTGILSSDGLIYSSSVITMESGQNGGRGWKNLSPGTPLEYGNPVESSHQIEGFFPGALWEEMVAVTQGAMTAEQIRINRTMGILAVCGVGCLALLMVLALFGKRSLIFRS